jgi:hypothetical protein
MTKKQGKQGKQGFLLGHSQRFLKPGIRKGFLNRAFVKVNPAITSVHSLNRVHIMYLTFFGNSSDRAFGIGGSRIRI